MIDGRRSDKAEVEYGKKTEELEIKKSGIDNKLKKLIKKVKERDIKKKKRKEESEVRKWWGRECRRKKKEVEKLLSEWRKGLVDKKIYLVGKRDYRRLREKKKEEWNKELLKKATEAKT